MAPSGEQVGWLRLAAYLASDLLMAGGPPERESMPVALEQAMAAHSRRAYAEGLTRRGLRLASSAAARYVSRCIPPVGIFAGPEVDLGLAALASDPRLHQAPATRGPEGARLAWADGYGEHLMLDRLHFTHLGGALRTAWMNGQVTADLTVGRVLAGSDFLGVRIVAPQAFAASLHITPDGDEHLLGGCDACRSGGCWA